MRGRSEDCFVPDLAAIFIDLLENREATKSPDIHSLEIGHIRIHEGYGAPDAHGVGIVEHQDTPGIEKLVAEMKIDERTVEAMIAIDESELEPALLLNETRKRHIRTFEDAC